MKRSVKNILLSMLGFSAAPILTACYGMPEPIDPDQYWGKDFKGKVTNSDGEPIEGIKVFVGTRAYHYISESTIHPLEEYKPVMTNAEGEFVINIGLAPNKACFVAEDVDQEAGGGWYATTEERLIDFDGTIEMAKFTQDNNSETDINSPETNE